MLETRVFNSRPVLIGGDMNIHVENTTDFDAVRLAEVFASFNLVQHFAGPTHKQLGGTLDLIAAFSDCKIADVWVDPAGIISDHGLVTCSVPARRVVTPVTSRIVRSWRSVNRHELIDVIRASPLGLFLPVATLHSCLRPTNLHSVVSLIILRRHTLFDPVSGRWHHGSTLSAVRFVVIAVVSSGGIKGQRASRIERRGRGPSASSTLTSSLRKMNTGSSE